MDDFTLPLPIAVTMGEPSGIGPEVILKSWYKRHEYALPNFFVIGSVELLQQQAKMLNLNIPIKAIRIANETEFAFNNYLPVMDLNIPYEFEFGVPNASTAPLVVGAIDKAVELIMTGKARSMATAPIHKAALYEAGFECPGHTEYLAKISTKYTGEEYHPVMMLAADELCVVPLTIHVPLKDVARLISYPLIIKTVRIIHDSMKQYFGLQFPNIAVAGLNPHAGENNAMGTEDSEIIAPAIEALKKNGIRISGPIPADTMFHKAARAKYDVALCMYHDQALIPLKTIDFDAGVNVTLGLPIIRTSPDHGTALDIAGQGLASPTSMINSLKLVDRISKNFTLPEDIKDV